MENKPAGRSRMIRNILIAAAAGIGVGLLLGLISELTGASLPSWLSGALIGAAIGGVYAALNKRQAG